MLGRHLPLYAGADIVRLSLLLLSLLLLDEAVRCKVSKRMLYLRSVDTSVCQYSLNEESSASEICEVTQKCGRI